MPTATPFNAGRGNGFPFCSTNVDISTASSSEMWTTLSGVNSGNYNSFDEEELAAKISQSLVLAMKLYWNKFKLNGLAAASTGDNSKLISEYSGTSEVWDLSLIHI